MDTATRRVLRTLLKQGENALLRRDYERASTYFRRAYTTDPGNIVAITNLGYSYAKMGRFSHAQKCFITALDIDPDNSVARKNLSLLMKPDQDNRSPVISSQGRGKPGEELFVRYMQWGNMQMEQKNLYAAIQYFREASKIHPDFIEPYLKIGLSFEELKEFAEAESAFVTALDIFPKDPVAREHLDRCRGYAGEYETGVESGHGVLYEQDYSRFEDENRNTSRLKKRKYQDTTPDGKPTAPEAENLQSPAEIHRETPRFGVAPDVVQETASPAAKTPDQAISGEENTQQSDDDVIRSILNQYSDLISTGKKPEPESVTPALSATEPGQPETVSQETETREHSQTPSAARNASPPNSDDIISSILMQYQDDLAETEPLTNVEPVKKEDTEIPHTGQAPLSEGEIVMKNSQKEGIRVALNDEQKDALRELGNIGASHAATTLSTMLNTPIMLNVPEISIMDFEEISTQIAHENSAMVIFTMEGQMAKAGYVVLHVPRESVVQMTSIMLGMPPDPTRDLNEMDESAINEIGNIMVSAFLDGTAELLGIIMLPSPPRTIFDFPKNVFDLIIRESNILYDNVVFFRTELICDEHELNLNIFMLPNPPVLQKIVGMLEQIIIDSAQGR
jgi:chemotaxis protein CheC